MTRPLSFAYRNVVFARGLDDAWALFRLETSSYPGRSRAGKRELLADLAAFAYALEADFSVLRASRAWSIADYVNGCELGCDSRHGHRSLLRAHLGGHARAIGEGAPRHAEPRRADLAVSPPASRPPPRRGAAA